MNPEGKEKSSEKDFGKVVDALHNKAKLSSLRTYQGDMAEFIRSKNESVISIAVKEKEKKEQKEKEIPVSTKASVPKNRNGIQINLTMIVLSLLLIAGGFFGFFYVFETVKEEPTNPVVIEEKIIPYNHAITLANVTSENFKFELANLKISNGISILRISDASGSLLEKSENFFRFLKISPPTALERTLKEEYVIGVISQDEERANFIIMTVDDFGKAFSAMLDWEKNLINDLSFLTVTSSEMMASSTGTTTPIKNEPLSWKDIIVKNKDTRALANDKNQAKIVYTFLDKNTILVTENLSAIGEISAAFASRAVVR